jgi:nucleotide-binding universal stress UspA family protein
MDVLWPVDGSSHTSDAIPWLRELVLPVARNLTVLSVVPHPVLSAVRPDPAYLTHSRSASRARDLAMAEGIAESAAAILDPSRSSRIETGARWGHPVEEILKESAGRDLIVMAAQSHSTPRVVALGSVAEGVALRAGCPVLIARAPKEKIDRVLIAYDDTAASQAAIRLLSRLMLPKDTEYLVASVLEPFRVSTRMPIAYRQEALAAAQDINRNRRSETERGFATATNLLAASGRRATTQIISGEPAQALDDLARREGADLLVVGTDETASSQLSKLVRHCHVSILVVAGSE